jgi:hypothetical protein
MHLTVNINFDLCWYLFCVQHYGYLLHSLNDSILIGMFFCIMFITSFITQWSSWLVVYTVVANSSYSYQAYY